jgi:hypothetical protein
MAVGADDAAAGDISRFFLVFGSLTIDGYDRPCSSSDAAASSNDDNDGDVSKAAADERLDGPMELRPAVARERSLPTVPNESVCRD